MELRYKLASIKVMNLPELHKKWGLDGKLTVSFNTLTEDFNVIAKLLPSHDKSLYHGGCLVGNQFTTKNNETMFKLLRNVDCVVSLEESTAQVFAMAHDVPVVIVDGFNYVNSNGPVPLLNTGGAYHTTIEGLHETVITACSNPSWMKEERRKASEDYMGVHLGNPIENIKKEICLNSVI
jgi:hypothetical protein